jgi:hypothetical protein
MELILMSNSQAVFGVQLVITIAMLSVLYRISSKYSFARWLLSGRLVRYLHPTDDQIMQMANLQRLPNPKHKDKRDRNSARHRKKGNEEESDDQPATFEVPRNTPFFLEACKIRPEDLFELKFYAEYQWLVDFGLCALLVFICSEIFYYMFMSKTDEINLSLIWCLLAIGFAVKMLFSLMRLYFMGDESIGERSLCITSGGLFFLLAMVVLVTDEKFLELGLDPAYASFNQSAHQFLEKNSVAEKTNGPVSKLLFKFWLAVACGITGSLFTFPGLRLAQMHKDCLKFLAGNRFSLLILNISFASPLLILLLWVRPVGRRLMTERKFGSMTSLMSPETFDTSRILLILLIIAIRFLLINKYLQAYLNLAPNRLCRLRKEAGKISNIELQKMIAGVFYYLCIVTLQYVGPLLLLLFTTLLYKVLGQYSWTGSLLAHETLVQDEIISHKSLKTVFTPILFRGLLGFATWWLTSVWFITSIIGFVYHTYYTN